MNKFDKFITSDNSVGPARLTLEISSKFGKYGTFSIDNADVILLVSRLENISPELLAVTWLNETTFRFYSEPNKNNKPDNFSAWDVGPMQLNVGYTQKDLAVGFFKGLDLDLTKAFGNALGAELFNGDPITNIRLAARKLKALGRADVIGKNNERIYLKASVEDWKNFAEDYKNLRRAMLYTGPEARNARRDSYIKFAPMFEKFFKVYLNNENS